MVGFVGHASRIRERVARDVGDQIVQDRDIELVEAAEEARIAEDIKEVERQD